MSTSPDTPDPASAHPVLTTEDSKRLEAALFAGDETREWPAMQRAGRALADAVLRDYRELDGAGLPDDARILVLVGKGHNGGDALIAAKHILEKHPRAHADVCFAFGERALRPLAMRAWRELAQSAAGSAEILPGGRREAPPKPPSGFEAAGRQSANLALPDKPAPPPRSRKLTNKETRELETLPAHIETLEAGQTELAAKLADPDFYKRDSASAPAVRARLDEIEKQLAAAYSRWEELETLRG